MPTTSAFLKDLDMNKMPFQLYQVSHNRNKEKLFSKDLGSRLGGLITVSAVLISIGYTITLISNMYKVDSDNISSKELYINFDPDQKEEINHDIVKHWSNFTLLPSIDIKAIGKLNMQKFDIYRPRIPTMNIFEFQPNYIDPEKLKRYIVTYIDMTHELLQEYPPQNYQHNVRFENCRAEHFQKYNFNLTGQSTSKLKQRLCPTFGFEYDQLYMKNDQSNTIERAFTAVKIRKCNPKLDNIECQPDSEIEYLLKNIMFTFYFATGTVQLGNQENYNKNPVKPQDNFFQQFQLSLTSYRDNNNFVKTHHINTRDHRFNILAPTKNYEFVDVVQGPIWTGNPYYSSKNSTKDGGKTWDIQDSHILFGSYFFLSNKGSVQVREVQNIMDVMSHLGGVSEIFLFTFILVASWINEQTIMGKIVRQLYFTRLTDSHPIHDFDYDNDNCKNKLYNLKFNFTDIFGEFFPWRRKDSKIQETEALFQNGLKQFQHELNAVQLFQTIQKLKASIQVLIQRSQLDRDELLMSVENCYFHNQTIYANNKLFESHQKNKSDIIKFFERDERDIIKYDRYYVRPSKQVDTQMHTMKKKEQLRMKLSHSSLYNLEDLHQILNKRIQEKMRKSIKQDTHNQNDIFSSSSKIEEGRIYKNQQQAVQVVVSSSENESESLSQSQRQPEIEMSELDKEYSEIFEEEKTQQIMIDQDK